jgi:hypothetical protein
MRSSLFCDVTQRWVIFGDISKQHIFPIFSCQEDTASPLNKVPIRCSETLVTEYRSTPRNIPEEKRFVALEYEIYQEIFTIKILWFPVKRAKVISLMTIWKSRPSQRRFLRNAKFSGVLYADPLQEFYPNQNLNFSIINGRRSSTNLTFICP